jgi:hypothetical protein
LEITDLFMTFFLKNSLGKNEIPPGHDGFAIFLFF